MIKKSNFINEKNLMFISAINILMISFLVNDQYRSLRLKIYNANSFLYLGILCIFATIFQLFIIKQLMQAMKSKVEYERLKCEIKSMEETNKLNRMQRHDYRNHLTVINGLILLDKRQQLKEYITKLIAESHEQGFKVDTGISELDVLLEAKHKEANDRKISLQCIIEAQLSPFSISPFDAVKIISNIIDNAIQALLDTKREEKRITFSISENLVDFMIEIKNNGNKIKEDLKKRIFEQGYSTKAKEGRGFGLYIVNRTVEAYGGSICVESDDEETKFTIKLPKIRK